MAASPTTLIDTRVSAPTANASRRVKFGCPICGKMCASRPRVGACLNNHMGIEPFVCNGNCGVINCPRAYASKALLTRHCTPVEDKMVACSNWYVLEYMWFSMAGLTFHGSGKPGSKQNSARHQENCNQ
ncbi:hypothetical protein CPB86DRAFT_694797 [Serendipita vermifera]|nr:hypothetical protein CPB86DRAFT_694797 [Serendipita vermifera]